MPENLVDGWKSSTFEDAPYLFADDVHLYSTLLQPKTYLFRSLQEYGNDECFGDSKDTRLHLGLVPQPYIGCLDTASIFILMLNPGLNPGDYYAEERSPEFKAALLRNLRQETANDEYPFLFLNPAFSWHPGFRYFHDRFSKIALQIKPKAGTYSKALSILARQVACLELIPYHQYLRQN